MGNIVLLAQAARFGGSRRAFSFHTAATAARSASVGVDIDVTERKNAELTLADRNMQLAIAGKIALVGTFAYDVDTEKMRISAGYAAIHGFPDGTTEIARSAMAARRAP